jgi:citrate lyase subunit alpha / citrate CoA-transferase
MGFVKNAADRDVPTDLNGEKIKPFSGASKNRCDSKIVTLKDALKKSGLKDGMTISFHHQLRNGDYVVNLTLETIRELGAKNLRLAQTALFPVHKPVIEHIEEGTVTRIEGSINGTVGDYVSKNPLPHPVILRSHGGRWAAVRNGELKIDIAVVAASTADNRGNCTGLIGKSAFGPICYSQADVEKADKVIVVTDNLVERPCPLQEISEKNVDYVVEVDCIGDPDNIVSGSLKLTTDPMKLGIGKECINLMDAAGLIKNGMIFQAGAGGISLAALKYLEEKLEEKNVFASCETGGVTEHIVNMYKKGLVKNVYGLQCFDVESIRFLAENRKLITDIGHYADPSNKGRFLDGLDTTIVGATEVDVDFNINVNTHSDGRLLHGIGGHQDTCSAAGLTIATVPVFRKKIPVIRDSVTTLTTPGDVVDAIVTNEGIAINPRRKDLIKKVKDKVNLVKIEDLRDMAYDETGGPPKLDLGDEIIGVTKWRDGTLLDVIYRVKE